MKKWVKPEFKQITEEDIKDEKFGKVVCEICNAEFTGIFASINYSKHMKEAHQNKQ